MLAPAPVNLIQLTADQVHSRLSRGNDLSLTYFAAHPEALEQRLTELHEEWDVERILDSGAISGPLLGLVLGHLRSPRWFLLPLAIPGFLMQHVMLGHCPKLLLLPRFAFRTRREIEHERRALEALRCISGVAAASTASGEPMVIRPWAQTTPRATAISA